MHNIKAYNIRNCKISRFTIFSGVVLNINEEPIIDSVKRKVGLDKLFCETINEEIRYSEISLFSVSVSELTIGDLLLITGNYNASTKLT